MRVINHGPQPDSPTRKKSKALWSNERSLHAQMSYIVRTVGKSHARRYLRCLMDSELVPLPHMLGVCSVPG